MRPEGACERVGGDMTRDGRDYVWPQSGGVEDEEKGKRGYPNGENTHEATLISSVKPPNHMTSGWMIAKDRFSINFLKPYLPSVTAHERSECADCVMPKYKGRKRRKGKRREERLTLNTRVHQL
jgi:hypothetical protein